MNRRYGRGALIAAALGAMLADANRPRQLADLPNTDGFRFTGHKLDGTTVQCIVRRVEAYENGRKLEGAHRAFTLDGGPIYRELCAWSKAEL